MKGNYGRSGNSSLRQYANKPTVKADLGITFIVEMMNTEWKSAIFNMKRIIPDLSRMISPVTEVVYDIQATEGNIDIKRSSSSEAGV